MPTVSEIKTQLDNLIEQVDAQYIALKDLPEGDPMRTKITNDMKFKQYWIARWQADYVKLTGRNYRPDWALWRAEAEAIPRRMAAQKVAEEKQVRDAEKTKVLAERVRIQNMLEELKRATDREWEFQQENAGFIGITMAGGGGPMLLAQANIARSRAEKALERAGDALSLGKLGSARQYLAEAAGYIQAGFEVLGLQEQAHATGAARVELAIKIGAAVGTGFATAGASAGATVAAETLGSAAQEVTLLGGKALNGKVTKQDLLDSAFAVLCSAAGGAAAGKLGGQLLGPRTAKLLFGNKVTKGEVKAITEILDQYFAGNSKQLAEFVQKSAKGEKFDWKFYSAVVAPALAAKGYAISPKAIEEAQAAWKDVK